MIAQFLDRPGTSDETVSRKRRALAGFFRFATNRHLVRSSPMPRPVRRSSTSSFTPYIYSEVELERLLAAVPAATGARSDIDAATLRIFLLLLYGAGLRRGEALRLELTDVDARQQLVHIRGTKFHKTRIVPLGSGLNAAVQTFIAQERRQAPNEAKLLCKRDGAPVTGSAVAAAFRRLRTIAGIEREGGARCQPRLHDLRHSAAVHRVTSWYRSGADLNDLLPKLATYLGHKDLSGTQRYLTMTDELLAEASRRFEAFARGPRHE
jgi:site-specific recombinase XerD